MAAKIPALNLPAELKALPQWVAWRYEERDGRPTKIPKNPKTGKNARADTPSTWGTIEEAVAACQTHGFDGIGFVFSQNDPFCGIDLDGCRNHETGEVEPWAQRIIEHFESYTEITPSGKGFHIIVKGSLPPGGRRKGKIELYDQERYFTFTGNVVDSRSVIAERQAGLEAFHRETFPAQELEEIAGSPQRTASEPLGLGDEELLSRARATANGAKFSELYDKGDWKGAGFSSQSEADIALCGMLAFWFGKDCERMDRTFRASKLNREKWETRTDYRNKTLNKAISLCKQVYKPPASRSDERSGGQCPEPETEWPEGYSESPPDSRRSNLWPQVGSVPEDGGFSPDELFQAAQSEQDGDAAIFIKLHRDRFRYDHSSGQWHEWAGHYWKEDLVNEALAAVNDVTELYVRESNRRWGASMAATKASKTEEAAKLEHECKVFRKKVSCLQRAAWKTGVLQLAASGKDSLGLTGEEWDSDPWVLPCKNGVVNLRDGSLRPGSPAEYFKTVCPTDWKGLDEPAPAWKAFQAAITNDEDIPGFKQRLFGSALPAAVIEQIFPVFWGAGRNGKGTELEIVKFVLGPLAGPTPAEMLLKQRNPRNPDAPTTSTMALRGKRIVWASETERGRHFDTAGVKLLVGGDTLVGRNPFDKRQVEFSPTHSLFLLTNEKPRADASDMAFWHRVLLIPFPHCFVDDPQRPQDRKRDPHLLEKLKAEASGTLAWLVRGCLEWQKRGLDPPETVQMETHQYRHDEDRLGRFLDERCIVEAGKEVEAAKLFKAYQEWAAEEGEKPVGGRTFGEEMKRRFDSYKAGSIRYAGIGLFTGV
jgi:putative DNA primase/helicase